MDFTVLRGNLATAYLSLVDALRALETEADASMTTRHERLRAELDAIDIEPLINEADFRW